MVVVGTGVIGVEYASMLAALGIKVTVVERRERTLDFCDLEIVPLPGIHHLQQIGIYTIPEISFIGRTEDELTHSHVPFEVGISRYRELARGQIIGDTYGMLKLLVSPQTRVLLGVHVFGTGATELLHIGQAVMGCGGTIERETAALRTEKSNHAAQTQQRRARASVGADLVRRRRYLPEGEGGGPCRPSAPTFMRRSTR